MKDLHQECSFIPIVMGRAREIFCSFRVNSQPAVDRRAVHR